MFISAPVVFNTLMNQTATPLHLPHTGFTEKLGRYLAFIHACTKIDGQAGG